MNYIRFAVVCWLLFAASIASSQSDQTPAPAAEATGTAAELDSPADINAARLRSAPLPQPFLQSDLNLLVGNVQRPNAMYWFDDYLYTVCNGDWTIYKIDDTNGDTITFVFGVKNGNSMLIEGDADAFQIWVPDPESESLVMVDQERQAPTTISDQFGAPWGITRFDQESLLITDTSLNAILQVDETGLIETIASELRSPTGIVSDENRIYFANGGSARRGIEWLQALDDGGFSQPRPLVSGLQNVSNIELGQDGLLYFAYALGTRGVVGRIDPLSCLERGCDNADVEMVIFSDLPAPVSMAISSDLRLFAHSRYRPEIYWAQLPT